MQDFFNWQGIIGTIFGIVGTVFSLLAWRKSRQVEEFLEREKLRLNEKIRIILTNGKEELHLPEVRRQIFTRSEIQGRLGTIPMKNKGDRYAIEYVNNPEYYQQIDRIAESSNETDSAALIIKCTDAELAQFASVSNSEQKTVESKSIKNVKRMKKV